MRLGRENQIRFVPTGPERISSAGELTDLFQISPPSDYAAGGLLWFLLRFAPRVEPPQPQALALLEWRQSFDPSNMAP